MPRIRAGRRDARAGGARWAGSRAIGDGASLGRSPGHSRPAGVVYTAAMPDYSRLRDFVSHRVVIEYDTGARIVGYVAAVRPNDGPVQLVNLSRARVEDAAGNVLEEHDSLSVCPNVLTGVHLEEGPSGRDLAR